MEIRWSPESIADLAAIIQYIRADSSTAALRVARAIYQAVEQLKTFPNIGRSGRVEGTRELPLVRLPFLVVYRVKADVEIARLLHVAQHWPPIDK